MEAFLQEPRLRFGTAPADTADERSRRALATALWIAQAVLAGAFAAAGVLKLSTPLPEVAKIFAWTTNVPPPLVRPVVKLVAAAELAAACAVVVPVWSGIVAELARMAATAAAVAMAVATAVQLATGDMIAFLASIAVCGLAAFVAWGRSRQARRGAEPEGLRTEQVHLASAPGPAELGADESWSQGHVT